MATNKPLDWLTIKTEFASGIDYAELSENHNVKEATIRQRAKRGNWSQDRHSTSQAVTERALESIIEVKANLLAKLNETDLSAAVRLREKADVLMIEATTANELKALAGTFDIAQKISRLALGAATENTSVSTRTLEPLKDIDFLG